MKKPACHSFFVLAFIIFFPTLVSNGQDIKIDEKTAQDSSVMLKDGTYSGQSRAEYIKEPYWGIVHLTVKNGLFTEINFVVRDSVLHETFDEKYEKHFEGNPVYIVQSRNDWHGVQTYPKNLSEKQDTNKLDAISGATWSYNIFRATVSEALKNSR
jgi:major membrane immunogen (membrane-anchored lipoprotein)